MTAPVVDHEKRRLSEQDRNQEESDQNQSGREGVSQEIRYGNNDNDPDEQRGPQTNEESEENRSQEGPKSITEVNDLKLQVNDHSSQGVRQREDDYAGVQQPHEQTRKPEELVNFGEESSVLQSDKCVITGHPENGQHVMLVEQLYGADGTTSGRQEYVLLFQEGPGTEAMEAYIVEGELDSAASFERVSSTEVKLTQPSDEAEVEHIEDTDDKPLAVRIDGRVYFRCDECDYVSRRRNYIKVHKQKVHVAPRALPCHVCQSAFLSTATLYAHMAEMHSAELPYACDQCGYRARARHRIASHRLSHDKEPRYKCGKCDFATRHKYLYTQHEFTHQEPLPFSCSLCDYKAKWRSSVYMHIKKRHGERLTEEEPWQEETRGDKS
ncbi:RE1-silencing transcription factor-like [Varroa destructor]|uniref:C2H2-type domain-containing protein n=2 Tax=Varroa TaxID=62624 RepID=A0A7M7MBY7_VARDE|nr:RE1-silencing transcription factor-like [Varroa destructor]